MLKKGGTRLKRERGGGGGGGTVKNEGCTHTRRMINLHDSRASLEGQWRITSTNQARFNKSQSDSWHLPLTT